jgi:hypothetical protein
MNGNHTRKPRPTTESSPASTTKPGALSRAPEAPAQTQPTDRAPQDNSARGSLLRQAGRSAVLSLAGAPALIVVAVVERWLRSRLIW